MQNLKWRRVGREHHSTDGRFQVYCSGTHRNFYGSYSVWVVTDRDGKPTSAGSLDKAKAAAERRA